MYTHSRRTLKTCFSMKWVSACQVYWPQIGLVNCRLVHQSLSMQIISKNFEPMSEKQMNQFCFECNMGTMSAFLLCLCVRCPVWNGLVRRDVYNSKVLWLKYFVLHKSTGAAAHKPAVYRCFLRLRGHVVGQATPELPSNIEDNDAMATGKSVSVLKPRSLFCY